MDLKPSRLTSWVVWRNYATTKDFTSPFNLLRGELEIDGLVTRTHWENANGGECPFCHGNQVVEHEEHGLIYCLCYILEWQMGVDIRYTDVRTPVLPAYLEDITYPDILKGEGRQNLKKAVDATQDFITEPEGWMIYLGLYGTGKTHLLRSINTALSPIAVYVAARDLEDMTHAYRKQDDMQSLYSLMRYAPVLLLDDIGQEYGGPLVRSMIDRIIDARYERWPDFPIVASSNMNKSELGEYLPRTGDRLNDLAKVNIVNFKGVTSYRRINPAVR